MVPSGIEPESAAQEAEVLSSYTIGPDKEYYRIYEQTRKANFTLFH